MTIAICSGGVWTWRQQIAAVTGQQPVYIRYHRPRTDAVACWGQKPSARRAERLAKRYDLPLVRLEDGFLRSVLPGQPWLLSLVQDWSGIYYDARSPSDLELLIAASTGLTGDAIERSQTAMELLRTSRLSKYNGGWSSDPGGVMKNGDVLVVDQTYGDLSIAGGLADEESFAAMLGAAITENPGKNVVIKTHPEVSLGRKKGYLAAKPTAGARILAQDANVWSLIESASRVYVVSSQVGFEALIAGKPVTCFGAPFYAGWGLTDDRIAIARRHVRPTLPQLFAAAYLQYCAYVDPYRLESIGFEEAVERLLFLTKAHFANNVRYHCVGISRWKRETVRSFLTGVERPEFHWSERRAIRQAARDGGAVLAWATRMSPMLEERCRQGRVPLHRCEDGFIRSAGLGAALNRPLSIVTDKRGIYYDPSRESDVEHLLQTADLSSEEIARARAIRKYIVEHRITKYNLREDRAHPAVKLGQEIILVPGQVSDDQSVLRSRSDTVPLGADPNIGLLKAVRARNPGAYIVYKPHPDVVAQLRAGFVDESSILQQANEIASGQNLLAWLDVASKVEVLTSLSGFEALIRQIPVTVHGTPFYAGWGLTQDLTAMPERTRRRSLDDLVALSLVRYPRYLHQVSLLPCPPEVAIEFIATAPRPADFYDNSLRARLLRYFR
jgi:capsular polysaccharide export protein